MKTVLIIDDEIKLRETIVELFDFIGFEIFEAQDGLEGLEKVKLHNPNLILCDVMMPNLDGYGFLKKHILSEQSQIPVVLLTAKTEKTDESLGKKLGASDYIKKPFSLQELKAIVEKHL